VSVISEALDLWRPHAILREGKKNRVYADSLGKLTGGIGHLIVEQGYKLGDPLPEALIEAWFRRDTDKALQTSLIQWQEIKKLTAPFLAALISVNFQLGDFSVKFKNSHRLLVEHEFDQAIKNIENSLWARQTPVRAKDFVDAIRRIK